LYLLYDGTYFLHRPYDGLAARPSWPGLLATYRQINAETALLPYALNELHFSSQWDAVLFLDRLDKTVVVQPGEPKVPLRVVVQRRNWE
jgi:hypothetical protein